MREPPLNVAGGGIAKVVVMRGSDSVRALESHAASKRAHYEASSNDHIGSLSPSSPSGIPRMRDTVVVIAFATRPCMVDCTGTSSYPYARERLEL
jgi:hypothetical protein